MKFIIIGTVLTSLGQYIGSTWSLYMNFLKVFPDKERGEILYDAAVEYSGFVSEPWTGVYLALFNIILFTTIYHFGFKKRFAKKK